MAMGVIGMLLLTRLSPSSSYAGDILPSLLVLGIGMGAIFAPAFGTATLGVPPNEAGIASAMVNTSQQVGGSVGTSLLSTLFASSAANFAASHHRLPDLQAAAMIHGYDTAFWWSVGLFAVGLAVGVFVLPWGVRPTGPPGEPAGRPSGSAGDGDRVAQGSPPLVLGGPGVTFVRILVALLGIAALLATFLSILRTVVLPRGVPARLARLTFLGVQGLLAAAPAPLPPPR